MIEHTFNAINLGKISISSNFSRLKCFANSHQISLENMYNCTFLYSYICYKVKLIYFLVIFLNHLDWHRKEFSFSSFYAINYAIIYSKQKIIYIWKHFIDFKSSCVIKLVLSILQIIKKLKLEHTHICLNIWWWCHLLLLDWLGLLLNLLNLRAYYETIFIFKEVVFNGK